MLSVEYRKVTLYHRITFGTFCFSFFAFFCCIIPGLTIWQGDLSRCHNHNELYAFISYILTFIAGISAYIGYHYGKPKLSKQSRITNKYTNGNSNISFTAVILLTISITALILYSSGYGGIVQTMLVGGKIRASFIQSSNSFAFFKHFIPLSIVSSLLLYTNIFINKNRAKFLLKVLLLLISFAISLIYIVANDGRALAGTYIFLFIFINIKYKYEVAQLSIRKLLITTCIICVIIFVIIIQSESWMNDFRNHSNETSDSTALDTLLNEFNFIYVGLYTSIDSFFNNTSHFVIFNDLVNGVFAWLPTSVKPLILEDIWDYNTKLINDGGYGQSPANIVATSFYDLGYIGVFIIPALYTYLTGRIERRFAYDHSTVGLTFFTVFAFYLGKAMAYFSLYNVMMNLFFIVIAWCLYKVWMAKIKV